MMSPEELKEAKSYVRKADETLDWVLEIAMEADDSELEKLVEIASIAVANVHNHLYKASL